MAVRLGTQLVPPVGGPAVNRSSLDTASPALYSQTNNGRPLVRKGPWYAAAADNFDSTPVCLSSGHDA